MILETYNGIDPVTSMVIELRKNNKAFLVNICRYYKGHYKQTLLEFKAKQEALNLFNDIKGDDLLTWSKHN